MSRTLANIKKAHYRVLHRDPASFGSGNYDTAANFATFLATFTELGYCRDKTIKAPITGGDEEILDDGTKLRQGYNLNMEGILLQSEPGDYTAYETIEGTAQDILLYSETRGRCVFYPNLVLYFDEQVNSGETESVPFTASVENAATKAAIRTRFAEPTS